LADRGPDSAKSAKAPPHGRAAKMAIFSSGSPSPQNRMKFSGNDDPIDFFDAKKIFFQNLEFSTLSKKYRFAEMLLSGPVRSGPVLVAAARKYR
jgi:hypothetical protein